MKSSLIKFGLAAFAASALTCIANALTINDPGVVGTVLYGIPADPTDRVGYVNHLLGMGANAQSTYLGQDYITSSTDYNGSVLLAGSLTHVYGGTAAELTIPAGYDFVIVKYDGPNAGSVVWALGGSSLTVPEFAYSIWGNQNQYGISGYTAFKSNPDTPSVPDGGTTVALLGLAFGVVALVPRKFYT